MFAQQYQQFKAEQEQKQAGFPLDQWFALSKSQVEELKYFRIFTVEQLAELPDSTGQKFPMFQSMKQKAQAFLEAMKAEAPFNKLQEKLDESNNKIAELQKQIEMLTAKKEK
jgi:hypothetical protein